MKVILRNKNQYVLRFELGEDYPADFIKFLKKKKIHGGFFFGLGGFTDPEIAYYGLKRRKYLARKYKGFFEVLSLVGNVAVLNGEIVIHNHVVLGKRNYSVVGGHLNKAKIGATLEIYFIKINRPTRKLDKNTGLNLLN